MKHICSLLIILLLSSFPAFSRIPEHLYLFGNYEGNEGKQSNAFNCIEFEKEGYAVFVLKNLKIEGVSGPTAKRGAILLRTEWGERFELAKPYRLDTPTTDQDSPWPSTLPVDVDVVENVQENRIRVGTYDFRIDFTSSKPKATLSEATPLKKIIAGYETLYLYGDADGAPVKFTKTATGFECRGVKIVSTEKRAKVYVSSVGKNFDSKLSPCLVCGGDGTVAIVRATDGMKAIELENGIYDFSIDCSGDVPASVIRKVEDQVAVPSDLYLFGNYEGVSGPVSFDGTAYIRFEKESEGVFVLKALKINVSGNNSKTGDLLFASECGDKYNSAKFYHIDTADELLSVWPSTLPASLELKEGREPSRIKSGTYNIRIDFTASKPKATFDAPTPLKDIIKGYDALYLYGGASGTPVRFAEVGTKLETGEVEIGEGASVYISPVAAGFNPKESPCLTIDDSGYLSLIRSVNTPRAIPVGAGKYVFTIEPDGDAPKLSSRKIEETKPIQAPDNLYMLGNYEGITGDNLASPYDCVKFDRPAEGIFELRNMAIGVLDASRASTGELIFSSDWGDNFDIAHIYYIDTSGLLLSAWPAKLPATKPIEEKSARTTVRAGVYDIRVDFSKPTAEATFSQPTPTAEIIRSFPAIYLHSEALEAPVAFVPDGDSYKCEGVELKSEESEVSAYIMGSDLTYDALTSQCLVPDDSGRLALVRSTSGKKSIDLEPGKYSFTLTFKGGEAFLKYEKEQSSVELPAAPDVPAVYYNLQGIRVEHLTPGIYIRRQGSKVLKVIVQAE